jgi:hypothetical protein
MAGNVELPTISRQAAVKGDQHVEALCFPNLAHHQAVRPHPQGFLDQPAERDLSFTLQIGLPALQPNNIAQRKLQFEDLLDRNDALSAAYAGREAVQQCGLSRLRGT